ncbi:MAG: glycosyltransferase [Cyanobacteriota bacterium]|nr:glycosyltransferase [Cyanobacteriota bacterium]
MNLTTAQDASSSPQKKIAIWYPGFMGGGAEAVALWMLEALKDKYDLTLFTVAEVDFARLNSMYGTQLSPESIELKCLSPKILEPGVSFAVANSKNARRLSFHLLIRYLKDRVRDYDLAISAYNAIDLGTPGMQYIHWVKVVEGSAFYQKISDFSRDRLKNNASLANSYFVAERVKRDYQIDATVVYPPVLLSPLDIPWEQKENAFICSGRLTKPKQPDKVIEILGRVRQQGFDLKLYLTGGGGGAYALGYRRSLQQIIDKNSDWVTVYENLKYKDYVEVISRCKYGIHYKKEPFGISIAEMVKTGAIPFVRSQGGQVEIVGEENQELFFDNADGAVEKIVRVLKDAELEKELRNRLRDRNSLFSAERFMSEVRQSVDAYFENSSTSRSHL